MRPCVLKTVEPYRLEYPIAFDFEGDSADYALKKGVTVTRTLVSAFARAFCGEIAAGKYSPMVYTNHDPSPAKNRGSPYRRG